MSQPKKLLVVEDQEEVRTILVRILSEQGYSVMEAAHGRQALERLETEPGVDLVLSDIVMPVMDGFELAAHLAMRKTPILFMTGYGQQHWYEAVPGPVLLKPFSHEVLCAEVKRILETPAS
jgi:two-component system response regulator (stage 0 sporulation protein F)